MNEPRKHHALAERKRSLAKIHIALKALDMPDEFYRYMLIERFRVVSARDLSNEQMKKLIQHFEFLGWNPGRKEGSPAQLNVLRENAWMLADNLEDGQNRLRGLCRKFCGCDDPEWCRESKKLKQLLAVLASYLAKEKKR
jgi:hypothetical protein